MSNVKKSANKKLPQDGSQPAETKKRGPRTKKQPTREEAIKMLTDASNELKQIIQELTEDESRLAEACARSSVMDEISL